MTKVGTVIIIGFIALGVVIVGSAFSDFLTIMLSLNAEKSPYDSGHSHGCSDAGKDPDDRYINEDGKGPSNHTNEFMDGYNDGYDDCSGSGSSGGGGSDDNDRGGGSNNGDRDMEQTQAVCVAGAVCYYS